MAETIEQRLAALGLTLPQAAAPAANYVPWQRSGQQVLVAGQLPMVAGKVAVTDATLVTLGELGYARTSLREIAAGKVHFNRPSADAVGEYIKQQKALFG